MSRSAKVHFRPGTILQQIAGTIHWCEETGQPLGIVGRDRPAQLLEVLSEGSTRKLTRAERRAFEAMQRTPGWADD